MSLRATEKRKLYRKVRDVYTFDDDLMIMVTADRISVFDVILPEGISYKRTQNMNSESGMAE